MRSIAFADFLIGVGILFVLEGLMFAAAPLWLKRAMKSALVRDDMATFTASLPMSNEMMSLRGRLRRCSMSGWLG